MKSTSTGDAKVRGTSRGRFEKSWNFARKSQTSTGVSTKFVSCVEVEVAFGAHGVFPLSMGMEREDRGE